MFKKKVNCPKCRSKISDSFDFCPYCGLNLIDPEKSMRDFGILGKNEMVGYPLIGGGGFGISDKMINSMIRSLFKAFDSHINEMNTDVQSSPGKIKIRFGTSEENKKNSKKENRGRGITEEQIKRMSGLPRVKGKTDVRRFSDKIVYEIKAPGLDNVEDVFVSKVESGYEVKAIGKKKVYVNSLPVNLPLKGYGLTDNGLIVEFGLD